MNCQILFTGKTKETISICSMLKIVSIYNKLSNNSQHATGYYSPTLKKWGYNARFDKVGLY